MPIELALGAAAAEERLKAGDRVGAARELAGTGGSIVAEIKGAELAATYGRALNAVPGYGRALYIGGIVLAAAWEKTGLLASTGPRLMTRDLPVIRKLAEGSAH